MPLFLDQQIHQMKDNTLKVTEIHCTSKYNFIYCYLSKGKYNFDQKIFNQGSPLGLLTYLAV